MNTGFATLTASSLAYLKVGTAFMRSSGNGVTKLLIWIFARRRIALSMASFMPFRVSRNQISPGGVTEIGGSMFIVARIVV